MDPRQREQLLEMLESDTGKRIQPEFHIDPNALAGVKVIYSNTQLDGTLEGAIDRLGDHLKYEVLKQI
jgi:F0F1-type ATP synthase delta subunit